MNLNLSEVLCNLVGKEIWKNNRKQEMSKNSCTARPAHSLLGMAFKFRCWFATFRKLLRSNYILDAVHHSDLKLIIPFRNYGYNLFIFISPESAKNLQASVMKDTQTIMVFFYNFLIWEHLLMSNSTFSLWPFYTPLGKNMQNK